MADEMNENVLKALSDPTRFQIVAFLSHMCCQQATIDEGGFVHEGPSASEICCHVTGAKKISSTISHHLHELEAAGLITIGRRGKYMMCKLRPAALTELAEELMELAKGKEQNGC